MHETGWLNVRRADLNVVIQIPPQATSDELRPIASSHAPRNTLDHDNASINFAYHLENLYRHVVTAEEQTIVDAVMDLI